MNFRAIVVSPSAPRQSTSAYGALSDVPVAYEASRSTVSIGATGNASGGAGYFAGLSKQEREKELSRREEHAAAREKDLDLRCVFCFHFTFIRSPKPPSPLVCSLFRSRS